MEFKKETIERKSESNSHKIYTKFIFAKNRRWWIEIFHRPLSITLERNYSIYIFANLHQTFSPTAPGVPSKIRSRKHVTNAQFSFDVISGEEIIGCIPPRIFYSRRGKKGGFKVARVAISGTLGQGGVVIRLGEGNGGRRGWDTFRGRSISTAVKAPPWAATQSNFQVGSNCILILDRSTVLSSRSFISSFFYLQWRTETLGGST